MSNITFSGGGFSLSETFIGKTINTIFPGNDYLSTLILLIVWFLIGIATLAFFFYFSKKRNMWKSLRGIQLVLLSVSLGFVSFMTIIFSYIPFFIMGIDFLNFKNGTMLSFMLLAAFLLYCCLFIASVNHKGRPFILKTFKNLFSFFMLFSMTFLAIVLTIKTREYRMLLWLIVDLVYIHYNIHPFFKEKNI